MAKYDDTIEKRKKTIKLEILEIAKEISIDTHICKKVGISRSTFYRWLERDLEFAKQLIVSKRLYSNFISDMAESVVIGKVKEKNLSASAFWLKHHRAPYMSESMGHLREKLDHELSVPEKINRELGYEN